MILDAQANSMNSNLDVNLPRITVLGQPFGELPQELYIPPGALEVFLETFSGPLDLLLYLIKKENLDILNIPIAKITEQYLEYIALLEGSQLELAADYLVMASWLMEIKSRMLLPRAEPLAEENDPRGELVRRLQLYELYRKAADGISLLPISYPIDSISIPAEIAPKRDLPKLKVADLAVAFRVALSRVGNFAKHQILKAELSVREKMVSLLGCLNLTKFTDFKQTLTAVEGKMGAAVTLLAVLELLRQQVIEAIQAEAYAPLYLKLAAENTVGDEHS